MSCPNCGREMERGYLTAGGSRILWTPKERRLSAIPCRGDVVLQKFTLTGSGQPIAYLCRACRKLVVDYSDSDGFGFTR